MSFLSTSREVRKVCRVGFFLRMVIGGLSDLMSETWEAIWILPLGDGLLLWLLGFVWSSLVWFLIFALPLDFHGRVRVVRPMYLPAALHGIEASLLASDSLRKLRSSICSVVWLLDGPTGCDPCFCVVWFRFRFLRRYLARWPTEVGRVYRLVEMVGEGCPGHGPIHLLSASAAEIVFSGIQISWLGLDLECTFPPLVEIRENPEFYDLTRMDKGQWPRCLLWHGWLPKLSGVNDASPWAAHAADSAGYLVESALGS